MYSLGFEAWPSSLKQIANLLKKMSLESCTNSIGRCMLACRIVAALTCSVPLVGGLIEGSPRLFAAARARKVAQGAAEARAAAALRRMALLTQLQAREQLCLRGGTSGRDDLDPDLDGPDARRGPMGQAALTRREVVEMQTRKTTLDDHREKHGWEAPAAQQGWEALLALAHFGVLSGGALLMRQRSRNRALRWACGALGYSNAVLALGGVMGNCCDLLGVPLFAMLSIPALVATSSALCALTFALLTIRPDAERKVCLFPGGLLAEQMVAGSAGIMTAHSTLSHLWSHSEMVADTSWSPVGLVVYKADPRPPTMTVLLSPLLLIASALRAGVQVWEAKQGAGLLAGALALVSGILGPETSCVWSWQLAQVLMCLALFVRLDLSTAATASSSAAAESAAAPIVGKLALRAAAAGGAGSSGAREELAKGLHRVGQGLGLLVHLAANASDGSGEDAERKVTSGKWWPETVHGVLLCGGALMPQLASALARSALRFSTGKRLHQSQGPAPERGAHTDVRIAANNLVVSPHMYVNSAQEGGVVQDWSHFPTMARSDAGDPDTGVYGATRVQARALARQPFGLSTPPPSQMQHGQPVAASTGKRVPGGRVAQESAGASSVTSSVMSRHPLHPVATRAALSREAGVSKTTKTTKAKGAMGSLVARRLAKPLPTHPPSNRRSPGTAARANKRVREAVRRRSGNELDGNQLRGALVRGALVQPGNAQGPPPSATQARQAGSTASLPSATRGRQHLQAASST